MRTVLLVIVMILCSGGCLEMATPSAIVTTRTQMEKLTNTIDEYQAKVVEITGEVNKKIDELQPIVEEAVEAVLAVDYSGDKVLDILRGIQAGNKVTSPINPYSGMIDSGLNILLGLMGVGTVGSVYVARKNSIENKRVVSQVSKLAAEATPDEGKKLIAVIS